MPATSLERFSHRSRLGRPLPWEKEDDQDHALAAKLAARYAAAASLAYRSHRHNDIEAVLGPTSAIRRAFEGTRFFKQANGQEAGANAATPASTGTSGSPVRKVTPARTKAMSRGSSFPSQGKAPAAVLSQSERSTTPSAAARDAMTAARAARRLSERAPSARLQLRSTSPRVVPENRSKPSRPRSPSPSSNSIARTDLEEAASQRPTSPEPTSPERKRSNCQLGPGPYVMADSMESLPCWPYDVLPAPTAVATEPVEACSPRNSDVAFSRGPESGRAAAAAAISAAASAVLAAHEAVEPLLMREAEQSPKALRQRSESPPWNPKHSPMPRGTGLQRSNSSTLNGSVARSPSAPRFPAPPLAAAFVRPLVAMPVLGRMSPTAVPFVPSFGGSLTSLPPASVVAYPQGMSRSPSPGGTMPSLEATRQLSPRETPGAPVYVGSPQHAQPVIVRRATSPQSAHGSVCLSPAASVPENRSMAAAAWAAAASPQGMLTRSSSGVLATRTLPPATRAENASWRARGGLDPADPLDKALASALHRLDTLTAARLEVQKLGAGRYQIEGRAVLLRKSSGASPRKQKQSLIVYEEKEDGTFGEGMDLSFYLSQAANVAASLSGASPGLSAVGRIPQELRLTFRTEGNENEQGYENVSSAQRQHSMRKAVEEAGLRHKAAEAVEMQLSTGFGAARSHDERSFTKATMLSL